MLKIFQAWLSLSSKEKIFILSSMLSGFLISVDYSIVRPASTAIFISKFGTPWMPYIWIATVPLNFFIIWAYQKLLGRLGFKKTITLIIFTVIIINLSSGLSFKRIPVLPFLFLPWKEVYILLMFQQLWSLINSYIIKEKANLWYGVIFGCGGLGGMTGGFLASVLAPRIGSEQLILFTPIFYLPLLGLFYLSISKTDINNYSSKSYSSGSIFSGFELIFKTPVLKLIMLMVVLMQFFAALTEYQFTTLLEKNILIKDLRTQYFGFIIGLTQILTTIFQFLGSFLLLKKIGVKKSSLFIPIVLIINALCLISFPILVVSSMALISVKSLDFSLFGIIRERFFSSLGTKERFTGKSIIDVFVSRSSKVLVSLLILGFQQITSINIISMLTWFSFIIGILWVTLIFKSYRDNLILEQN